MGTHSPGEVPRFGFVFLNACQLGTSGNRPKWNRRLSPGAVVRGRGAGLHRTALGCRRQDRQRLGDRVLQPTTLDGGDTVGKALSHPSARSTCRANPRRVSHTSTTGTHNNCSQAGGGDGERTQVVRSMGGSMAETTSITGSSSPEGIASGRLHPGGAGLTGTVSVVVESAGERSRRRDRPEPSLSAALAAVDAQAGEGIRNETAQEDCYGRPARRGPHKRRGARHRASRPSRRLGSATSPFSIRTRRG